MLSNGKRNSSWPYNSIGPKSYSSGSQEAPPPCRWRCGVRDFQPTLTSGSPCTYIMQGIMEGFRIGANRSITLRSAKQNMLSAVQHLAVIEEYLAEEVQLGRLLPLPRGMSVHISRFGVILKGHVPGKWRMITDLSSPHGASVNDAIHSDLCSLEYITVDCVARRACEMGLGALLAKADVKSAYRIVLVHPRRHPLARRAVEQRELRGPDAPIWPTVGAEDF